MLRKKNINISKQGFKPNIIVVMPAYNAEKTLKKTVADFPKDLINKIILVDDGSNDKTVRLARELGLTVFVHTSNLGYGGNQKTCYWEALKSKPDVVVMIHPDYQYDASLIGELVRPILSGRYDMMYGNRIRSRNEVLAGGMPLVKYLINRLYCVLENIILGANFSEYFSGMRAYSWTLLNSIPYQRFSNDFVFDQQMMISAYAQGFKIGEIDVPVRYFSEASSISYLKGTKFLLETIYLLLQFWIHKTGLKKNLLFINKNDTKI